MENNNNKSSQQQDKEPNVPSEFAETRKMDLSQALNPEISKDTLSNLRGDVRGGSIAEIEETDVFFDSKRDWFE
ncbi:hypothetical protein ABK040_014938 [Willaertia magna]